MIDKGRNLMGHEIVNTAQNRNPSQISRASRQAVIKNAQDIDIATAQTGFDDLFCITCGADQNDIWGHKTFIAPTPDY